MRHRYQYAGKIHEIRMEREGSTYQAVIDGKEYSFEVLDLQPGQISLRIHDQPVTLYWAEDREARWLSYRGCTFKLEKPARPTFQREGDTVESNLLRAPMPAQVREVMIEPGEIVEQGQTLLLLEAMKMEIRIQSPRRARVSKSAARAGEQVEREQVLVQLEDVDAGDGD